MQIEQLCETTSLCASKLDLIYLKLRLPKNYLLTNHKYNQLTVCKQMSSASFKKCYRQTLFRSLIYLIYV